MIHFYNQNKELVNGILLKQVIKIKYKVILKDQKN